MDISNTKWLRSPNTNIIASKLLIQIFPVLYCLQILFCLHIGDKAKACFLHLITLQFLTTFFDPLRRSVFVTGFSIFRRVVTRQRMFSKATGGGREPWNCVRRGIPGPPAPAGCDRE